MDIGKIRIIFLTVVMACFSFLLSHAQPVIKATVDKPEILIGDQFKLKIEAGFTAGQFKISWPLVADSLPHFEVVDRGKIDSLYSNQQLSGLAQTFTITSFDSGKWLLPSFKVNIDPLNDDTTYNFFTDSIPVTVSFSTSDTSNLLRDIKPIREVAAFNPFWYWIGAGILLVALVIFLVWFYRYWKKNKGVITNKLKASAYEEAMAKLEQLKSFDLADPASIKIVHTQLGEILKGYLSRLQHTNYQNKTTGDILVKLSDQVLDKNMLANTAACLRCGDAVKFARYLPPQDETAACMQTVKLQIDDMQQRTIKLIPKP